MDESLKNAIVNNFRNTELGFLRIRKNLKIEGYSDAETNTYLRKILKSTSLDRIVTRGKNHYFTSEKYNAVLTINSHSLTVITAKLHTIEGSN